MRGVLVAGTAALKGLSLSDGERLAPPPNTWVGFGRVDLSRALPLATNTSTGWRMQVGCHCSCACSGLGWALLVARLAAC